jgi:hypothetical protein
MHPSQFDQTGLTETVCTDHFHGGGNREIGHTQSREKSRSLISFTFEPLSKIGDRNSVTHAKQPSPRKMIVRGRTMLWKDVCSNPYSILPSAPIPSPIQL